MGLLRRRSRGQRRYPTRPHRRAWRRCLARQQRFHRSIHPRGVPTLRFQHRPTRIQPHHGFHRNPIRHGRRRTHPRNRKTRTRRPDRSQFPPATAVHTISGTCRVKVYIGPAGVGARGATGKVSAVWTVRAVGRARRSAHRNPRRTRKPGARLRVLPAQCHRRIRQRPTTRPQKHQHGRAAIRARRTRRTIRRRQNHHLLPAAPLH